MSETQVISHKRGDTFSMGGLAKLSADGTWSASCTVKTVDGDVIEPLTVSLEALIAPDDDGNTHTILLEGSSEQAADWPLALLKCDVRFANDSTPPVVAHSPTFVIRCVKEITELAD